MSSGQERMAAFLDLVYKWIPLFKLEFQLAFVETAMHCVYKQWYLEVFLSPCSDVHYRTISVFDANIAAFIYLFSAWSLAHRDLFSP